MSTPDWKAWKAHLIVCAACTAGHVCAEGAEILGDASPAGAPWLTGAGAPEEARLERLIGRYGAASFAAGFKRAADPHYGSTEVTRLREEIFARVAQLEATVAELQKQQKQEG
jgi:hypothetical protein